MKTSHYLAVLFLLTAIFTGCETNSSTPDNDTTKLWPARSVDGKKAGYIDSKGNMVVNATYFDTFEFSCGYGLVYTTYNQFSFIDKNGKPASGHTDEDGVDYLIDYHFYYDCFRFRTNGKYGMWDKSFKTIIRPIYSSLGSMSPSGLTYASIEGDKYGYLNKKGTWDIDPQFDRAHSFEDDVAVVSSNGKYGAINTRGEFVLDAKYAYLCSVGGERLIYCDDTKKGYYGLMDLHGNIITDPIYNIINSVADNGLYPVCKDKQYGYINNNGDVVIPLKYDYAMPFYEGHAWVKQTKGGKYELIDNKGLSVLTLKDKEQPITVFHNGLCRIWTKSTNDNNSVRYIDTNGKTIYSWIYVGNSGEDVLSYNLYNDELNLEEMFAGTQYGYRFSERYKRESQK